ncbi:MAG: ATP-binding cassette domain-containing protein [Acutalibacteraceae bacterium]|nr:ATP-binding cassette domain-containing protein [Acutalibacteraceae bacterium]
MGSILTTNELSKKYKNHMAVNCVDMNIDKGDIYGFVGENGSGKTTVIRLITGLISPYSGSFSLFGVDSSSKAIGSARSRIGAIVEKPSIYMNMSAYDNLKTQCTILGIEDNGKIASVLKDVGLESVYADKKHASNFSLGMRQRLGIAMALLGDPEFLILDEPLNGLDPAGIVEIRELILKLNKERGITFLISSHILTELSLVATKYGIISKGKIIKEITAEQLHNECSKNTEITADEPQKLLEVISGIIPKDRIKDIQNGVRIMGEVDLTETLSAVISAGIKILSVNCNETSFEEYYLSVIGGGVHE